MSCRSVYRDITAGKFEQLHGEAFQDARFVDSMVAAAGLEPASARWEEFSLPGTSLLEIGPGTGHLLAAAHKAGRSVAAVESSEVHRAFIRDTWGIRSLYPDITAIPDGLLFDAVVAINVSSTSRHHHLPPLDNKAPRPGGRPLRVHRECGISGSDSAKKLVVDVQGARPCSPFPHPRAWREPPECADLRLEQVWSSELPFELPISALVAARDWTRARRGPSVDTSAGHLG